MRIIVTIATTERLIWLGVALFAKPDRLGLRTNDTCYVLTEIETNNKGLHNMSLDGDQGGFFSKEPLSGEQIIQLSELIRSFGFEFTHIYSYEGSERIDIADMNELVVAYQSALSNRPPDEEFEYTIMYDHKDQSSLRSLFDGGMTMSISDLAYSVSFYATWPSRGQQAYYDFGDEYARKISAIVKPFFALSGDGVQGPQTFESLSPFKYSEKYEWERYHYFSRELVNEIGPKNFKYFIGEHYGFRIVQLQNGAFEVTAISQDFKCLKLRRRLGLGEPYLLWEEIAEYQGISFEEVRDFYTRDD